MNQPPPPPDNPPRMSYGKPKLRTIRLVAEEVLGIGCKNVSMPAVGPVPCTVNNCSQAGS